MYEVKTKVMISCKVTAQLICTFFSYTKSMFSHDAAHSYENLKGALPYIRWLALFQDFVKKMFMLNEKYLDDFSPQMTIFKTL